MLRSHEILGVMLYNLGIVQEEKGTSERKMIVNVEQIKRDIVTLPHLL
jgi:hypothetical protein